MLSQLCHHIGQFPALQIKLDLHLCFRDMLKVVLVFADSVFLCGLLLSFPLSFRTFQKTSKEYAARVDFEGRL